MKNLKILNMLTCYQKRGYYKMPVTSLSQIKSDFQNFKGGSIDLSKVSYISFFSNSIFTEILFTMSVRQSLILWGKCD